MSTNVLDPISTVTTPDSEQESDFELDVRISTTLDEPMPTDAGTYTCSASNCSNCCPPTRDSIWYAWCCD